MATSGRSRLIQGVILALAVVPAYKLVEPLFRVRREAASARSIHAGRDLFLHEWKPNDSLAGGDGLGPVFDGSSCLECHQQGGPGGAGPAARNIILYGLARPHPRGFPRSGIVHQRATAPGFQETMSLIHASLPSSPIVNVGSAFQRLKKLPEGVELAHRNTPALFGAGLLDALSEETITAHQRGQSMAGRLLGLQPASDPLIRGRVARLADGRIGRFGWKAEFASLTDVVRVHCALELGLSTPAHPQAVPLGRPSYRGKGTDLSDGQCMLLTDFVRSLPAPLASGPSESGLVAEVNSGAGLFHSVGCAGCHSEALGSVQGLYSDLLLHDMGAALASGVVYPGALDAASTEGGDPFASADRPTPGEWRTPPLWGIADSAPYLHDGRAATLEDAILAHGGEAAGVTARFKNLSLPERRELLSFLGTLRAPRVEPAAATSSSTAR